MPSPKKDNESDSVDLRNILTHIKENASDETIIVTDVGQHQMITAQYYSFEKPRTFVSSCGLGTMGFGLGAAIGAKFAYPEKEVVLITGDGSFHMNMQEMACVVSEDIDIKVIVINNSVLGMVRQWQQMFFNGRYSNTSIGRKTDFVKLAEAFGAKGYRVTAPQDVATRMKEIFSYKGAVIAEFVTDKNDNVFPIIPPGKSAKHIIIGEDLTNAK